MQGCTSWFFYPSQSVVTAQRWRLKGYNYSLPPTFPEIGVPVNTSQETTQRWASAACEQSKVIDSLCNWAHHGRDIIIEVQVAGGFSRRLKGSNPDLRESMPLIRSRQGFLSVVGPVPQANKLSHLTDLTRLQEMFEPQTLYDPSRWYVQYTPSLPQCMKNAGQYHSHGWIWRKSKWELWWWRWLFRYLQGFLEIVWPFIPRLFFFFFFKVECLHTLIPLFRPGSVHNGSPRWDDCGRMFPDKLRVRLFLNRFPHYARTAA